MEIYDIFKSEGGYRVCGAVWGDGPIMKYSPWFETMEEAQAEVQKMRFEEDVHDVGFYDGWSLYGTDPQVGVWVAVLDDKERYFPTKAEAKACAVEYLEHKGWPREYILEQRPDFA